jgi:hypothetical protein
LSRTGRKQNALPEGRGQPDHGDTRQRETLWRNVQHRTAVLSPKGRLELVRSGLFIRKDQPKAVVAAVLSVAAASGAKTAACRR